MIIGSFDPSANGMLHPTVVRSRGFVSIRPTSFAADLSMGGAFGVCLVSDEAFTAGTAAIPRPFDDANWGGWMLWRAYAGRYEFHDATGSVIPANLAYELDSKAMRKVSENETIVLMCESQTGAIDCTFHLRQLLLLS